MHFKRLCFSEDVVKRIFSGSRDLISKRLKPSHTHAHTPTCTHTHAHTHTCTHAQAQTVFLIHTHTVILHHTNAHIYTPHSHTLFCYYTQTITLTHALTHKHCSFSHTGADTHYDTLYFSLNVLDLFPIYKHRHQHNTTYSHRQRLKNASNGLKTPINNPM